MATFIFSPLDPGIAYDGNIVIVGDQVSLRGYDPNGDSSDPRLDPSALYAVSGQFVTRNMTLRDLSAYLWGSEVEVDIPSDCAIYTEFSINGGSSWVGGTYEIDQLAQWLEDNLFVPDRLMLRFTLQASSDRKYAPILSRVLFYGDAEYDVTEDVARTVKRVLRSYALPFIRFRFRHTGGSTFVLKTGLDTTNLYVFTLDNRDPSENLVQSYNPTTQEVTLTSSIPAGTPLEVQGVMRDVAARIHPDPDYIKSNTPLYVVRILGETPGPGKLGGDEFEKRLPGAYTNDSLARVVERPIMIDVNVAVDCVADREVEAYAMARAVRKLLNGDDSNGRWQSLGMGYFFDVVGVTPIDNMTVPEEAFHDFQVRFTLTGKEYSTKRLETTLATSFEFKVGNELIVITDITGD